MVDLDGAPSLSSLLKEIRECRHCADNVATPLPHAPRPVLQASGSARIGIFGQAPGTRVHESGRPFTDPSGDRLRAWLQLDDAAFYDASKVAIIPMGFCFPGLDAKGGDKPPRKECAPLWRPKLIPMLSELRVVILVGRTAQQWHLGSDVKRTLTDTVANWRAYGPRYFPTPHPSWRNNVWLKKNAWFEEDVLPALRDAVRRALA